MIRAFKLAALAAAIALPLTLPLAGCISVFPKADPVQLYRFGDAVPPPVATGPQGAVHGVLKLPVAFTRAAAGDQILTVGQGGETAYVKDARWISPAAVLFDEAINRAFEGGQTARLVTRGEVARADYMLKMDVRTFEARYQNGPKVAPVVKVELRAVLTQNGDRTLIGDRTFTAAVPAADNRVTAIVAAYDKATAQVLGEAAQWTNAGVAGPSAN